MTIDELKDQYESGHVNLRAKVEAVIGGVAKTSTLTVTDYVYGPFRDANDVVIISIDGHNC